MQISVRLFGLAEVFLAQARWPELEEIRARLGGVDAAVLGARVHLANQQYAAGQLLLEEAVAHRTCSGHGWC